MTGLHLAQLNIGELLYPIDDPRVSDFVDNLERVNSIAERAQGFVWRLKDESGNATGIVSPWPGSTIVNMSVWETPEDLENFVWNTVHKRFYNRRTEWFSKMKSHHFVMWWIRTGIVPTLSQAKARLDHLDRHGESDYAFTWASLPDVRRWQSQRCG